MREERVMVSDEKGEMREHYSAIGRGRRKEGGVMRGQR